MTVFVFVLTSNGVFIVEYTVGQRPSFRIFCWLSSTVLRLFAVSVFYVAIKCINLAM